MSLTDQLHALSYSLRFIYPELILLAGLCSIIVAGMIRKNATALFSLLTAAFCILSASFTFLQWPERPTLLFEGMFRQDDFSSFWKVLLDLATLITVVMTGRNRIEKPSEYFLLLIASLLGAHLLVMSMNFLSVLLSLELISLSSYALAGWNFSRSGTEGSLKYFLFGSVATATMLYGMSLLYGLAGTLDFSSEQFVNHLIELRSPLFAVGGLLTFAGFLFKMAATPMHLWAPDVYQSAPTPVVAFFSVVPKLAGFAALIKFVVAVNLFGQGTVDWQTMLAWVAGLSIMIGNFSALGQTHPKRMLAYSSIAHAGFLIIGIVPISESGVHAALFYGAILLLMNFLTFHTLQQFERLGVSSIAGFAGLGRSGSMPSIALTVGLVALIGLPVTAGFSAKIFIFSGLWEAYSQTHSILLLGLFVFGLANTVVSLFYYLRIPFYLFFREATVPGTGHSGFSLGENLLSLILVVLLVVLFFRPDLLMGWIIRVNFVM